MVNHQGAPRARDAWCALLFSATSKRDSSILFSIFMAARRRRLRAGGAPEDRFSMPSDPTNRRETPETTARFEREVELTTATCRAAIDGRLAARAIAEWLRPLEMGEAEFQALWFLRFTAEEVDQATIAARLALSPAQVSHTVDRLGRKGWIAVASAAGDRRRRLWRLTPHGAHTLDEKLRDCGAPLYGATGSPGAPDLVIPQRKEAA